MHYCSIRYFRLRARAIDTDLYRCLISLELCSSQHSCRLEQSLLSQAGTDWWQVYHGIVAQDSYDSFRRKPVPFVSTRGLIGAGVPWHRYGIVAPDSYNPMYWRSPETAEDPYTTDFFHIQVLSIYAAYID